MSPAACHAAPPNLTKGGVMLILGSTSVSRVRRASKLRCVSASAREKGRPRRNRPLTTFGMRLILDEERETLGWACWGKWPYGREMIATHDLELVRQMKRRVLVLENGRLIDDFRPADRAE